MRQYVIDEIRKADMERVRAYLAERTQAAAYAWQSGIVHRE